MADTKKEAREPLFVHHLADHPGGACGHYRYHGQPAAWRASRALPALRRTHRAGLRLQDAIGVCLFVMILGGFLGIITETGARCRHRRAEVHKLKGNELVLIPILMFIFSIGGTTYGMCEETVPFYLLLAATMVAASFDSLTGAAVVLFSAGCGVLGSTVNPFAVGVAVDALSGIGIAVNQGIIIALGAISGSTTIISIIFVMRYAKKVKADKGSTFLSLQEQQDMMNEWGHEDSRPRLLTVRRCARR